MIVLLILAAFAAGAWLFTTRADLPVAAPVSGPVPDFKHAYLIVFENHPYDEVMGEGDAPTFNAIASQGAIATDYHSVERPSQPNYVALISGSTQGIKDDHVHDFEAPNLADQLEAKGLSWAVSAENVPDGCFTGEVASGGADSTGTYARKHEPFISFSQISGNQARCAAHIHGLSAFDPAEATFQLIVPNLCHDAHDCSLQEADTWLAGFAPRILDSAAFADGGVLFITFDEADRSTDRVPMIAVGTGVLPGTQAGGHRDHFSWLRTLQDAWGLSCLAESCNASNLAGMFQSP